MHDSIKNAALLMAENALEQSDADIILRTFIGMVFIMVLMWLAVIITGKIGKKYKNVLRGDTAETTPGQTEENEPEEKEE